MRAFSSGRWPGFVFASALQNLSRGVMTAHVWGPSERGLHA
jgi:hypothetical protein